MKLLQSFLISLVLVASMGCQQPQGGAAMSDEAFNSALTKFLKTDQGSEALGSAVQNYVKKQQEKMQADQAKKSMEEFENQFKNPVKVDIGNSPVKGPSNAKITIIEFSDFECPFCKRGKDTAQEVLKAYPNDVKLVFKNLPLPFHQHANPAARAALAAGAQGKFWEMHDVLFDNQKDLGDKLILDTAKKLGLNIDKFKKDMDSEAVKKQIEEDTKTANSVGISGTPGFVVNGVLVKGAYPIDHFKKIIDRFLAQK